MGIRQLPSGAFQVRFQHRGTSYAATYPTRELAEEAEPLLRAAAIAGGESMPRASDTVITGPGQAEEPSPPTGPSPDAVGSSSSGAAQLIDIILADFVVGEDDGSAATDEEMTTGQAAALLGVSRPTLVSWLRAGRIPYQWQGAHRRVRRSDVLAYRHNQSDGARRDRATGRTTDRHEREAETRE